MGRKSASSFRKCALLPEVADLLPSPTGLYRSDGLTQSNDKAKHGEEPAYEVVTDNLPDIVPVTQKEMEVLERLWRKRWHLKETDQRVRD